MLKRTVTYDYIKFAYNRMCIFRSSKESMSDGVTLSNDDAQRLLRAMKEFLQITSDEQDQQTADGNRYGFYV